MFQFTADFQQLLKLTSEEILELQLEPERMEARRKKLIGLTYALQNELRAVQYAEKVVEFGFGVGDVVQSSGGSKTVYLVSSFKNGNFFGRKRYAKSRSFAKVEIVMFPGTYKILTRGKKNGNEWWRENGK